VQVLIAEDDVRMAALLKQGLTEDGHVATLAETGTEALGIARAGAFDVMILDVMLPGMDGFAVARQLRNENNRLPILMLTARDQLKDIVTGLDVGADDYLTKPFSLEELLARVRAVGRRGPIPQPVLLHVEDLTLDTGTRTAARRGESIPLTRTEYALLELLMRRSGRVVLRETILNAVWGFDKSIEANTLDAFVRLLRAKVDHGHSRKLIHTVRGVGYLIRAEIP